MMVILIVLVRVTNQRCAEQRFKRFISECPKIFIAATTVLNHAYHLHTCVMVGKTVNMEMMNSFALQIEHYQSAIVVVSSDFCMEILMPNNFYVPTKHPQEYGISYILLLMESSNHPKVQ
jgi:hypothetical protein